MVTSMYKVKLSHGSYDGELSHAPTVNEDSNAGYSEGYTLLVSDGTDWVCLDATVGAAVWEKNDKYDEEIILRIKTITEMLFDYLNNPFKGNRPTDEAFMYDVTFSGDTITSTGDFGLSDGTLRYYSGDNIRIVGSVRDDGFYDVLSSTEDHLIVTPEVPLDIIDGSSIFFGLVVWPTGLEMIAANMVAFDVYSRSNNGLKSESIGTYSYTTDEVDVNGIAYPASVISGLMVYKVPRFV